MDIKQEIDLEGLYEETEVFMFAGHDTTTSTLAYALGFITENQNIKQKCQNEIRQVLGNSTRPTSEHLKSLKYLGESYSLVATQYSLLATLEYNNLRGLYKRDIANSTSSSRMVSTTLDWLRFKNKK